MRDPWDAEDTKNPLDPDLKDPFGGELGDVAEPESPKPAKRPAPAKSQGAAKKATPTPRKAPRKRA